MTDARRLLSQFWTSPEDLAALKTFRKTIAAARGACEETTGEEERRYGEGYVASLERCYKHLDEMLGAGLSEMNLEVDQVLVGLEKRLWEKENEIMDLLSEIGLLRSRIQNASSRLHDVGEKMNKIESMCEVAWMLGEVAALLEKGP